MSAKIIMNKKVYDSGRKRVNLVFTIQEYDNLTIYAEAKNIPATTAAKSLLMPKLEKEVDILLQKEKYVPKNARGLKCL